MDDKHKKYNFLGYINNPMSKESIKILYDGHNIKFEKCELFSDFVQSLLMIAFDTYMGNSVTDITQQKNHFKWSWDKNIQNFKTEGLLFSSNKLYEYFLEFMLEVYYSLDDSEKHEKTEKMILNLWFNIFDYDKSKSLSDMDTLIEIYQIFQESLKPIEVY